MLSSGRRRMASRAVAVFLLASLALFDPSFSTDPETRALTEHGGEEHGHGEQGHEPEHGEHGEHGEGEHGEGEHGEHGEHGEGEHHLSLTLLTTAYLLVGFLVANFGMLKLVNWPDPHIRSFSWKMISGTVSIYLAVILNSTLSKSVLYLVTQDVQAASRFNFQEVIIQVTLLLTCFGSGNFLCHWLRETKDPIYAVAVIGGHITAFAGIGALQVILKLEPSAGELWLTAGCVLLVSGAIRGALVPVRIQLKKRDKDATQCANISTWGFVKNREAGGKEAEAEPWEEKVTEAEDDACAIICSFAIMEAVMKSVWEEHPHEPTANDIKNMSIIQGVCVLVLIGTTYGNKMYSRLLGKSAVGMGQRAVNFGQATVAMTMSWLAVHLFMWVSSYFWKVSHEFTEIISAALLTIAGVGCILILDKVADRAHAQDKIEDAKDGQTTRLIKQEGTEDAAETVLKEAFDFGNLESALRVLIEAICLAVGLSWEHAFHAALHTITASSQVLSSNQVLANFSMAVFSCLLMLPVWSKNIVPSANRHVKEFERIMELEENAKKFKGATLRRS